MKRIYLRNFIATALLIVVCFLTISVSIVFIGRSYIIKEYQEKMENAKHRTPFTVIKPEPVVEAEEEKVPDEPRRSRRKKAKKEKDGNSHGFFDLTNIITKFFSEENEIKE